MPVDKKILAECIAEASGDDAEMVTFLTDRYSKNDALAVKFVGGFMRDADYRQKTQGVADQKKQFDAQATQLENARKALESAETEKNKIMTDLANHRITVAKAREMAKILADKYELTDTDLPGISDLIATAKTGKVVDNTDDLETRLAAMRAEITKELETKFVKSLGTELGAMADLDVIWPEIMYEHEQLTGKRMTAEEQRTVLAGARKGEGSLREVWEKAFNISGDAGLRMKKRDEGLRATWQQEAEAKAAKERQDAALNVVTPKQTDLGAGPGVSNVFKTRFKTYEMDPNKAPVADNGGIPSLKVEPGQHVRQTGDRGPSGAQRAAAKFLEQRAGKVA